LPPELPLDWSAFEAALRAKTPVPVADLHAALEELLPPLPPAIAAKAKASAASADAAELAHRRQGARTSHLHERDRPMSLQPGTYKARAISADFGESEKGTQFIAVTFVIEFAGDGDSPGTSETITWFGYCTDKTSERTIESLRYCGCTFPGSDISRPTGSATARDVVLEKNRNEAHPCV
jgi:hypothetical protein